MEAGKPAEGRTYVLQALKLCDSLGCAPTPELLCVAANAERQFGNWKNAALFYQRAFIIRDSSSGSSEQKQLDAFRHSFELKENKNMFKNIKMINFKFKIFYKQLN